MSKSECFQGFSAHHIHFFLIPTLFIRFVFDVIIPVWIAVFFVIVLTISVFYSIGIERKIAEYIDKESNSTNQTKI